MGASLLALAKSIYYILQYSIRKVIILFKKCCHDFDGFVPTYFRSSKGISSNKSQ